MEFSDGFNEFSEDGMIRNRSSPVMDDEKEELASAPANQDGKETASSDKAVVALRNHSEAERRRRERINSHLATLRTLIPGTIKMDKAALLGVVIKQVKQLRHVVAEARNGTLLPSDSDELTVEEQTCSSSIRASLCCEFKHQLLFDLREAMESLPLKIMRSEIATLGSRMVYVFVISGKNEEENMKLHVDSVRQVLESVLHKFRASEELNYTGKRRRIGCLSTLSSSSMEEIW